MNCIASPARAQPLFCNCPWRSERHVTRVLIIDDEETLARNIRTYLTRHGYEARIAGSGEEGLAALDSFNPDLVLLDFQLPGMDGLEILRRIRTAARHVKVVMMTAHGGVPVAVDAMKAGAYDYLTKPLALSELKLLLDKAIGQNNWKARSLTIRTGRRSAAD